MNFAVGDLCRVHGLKNNTAANGRYCEIVGAPESRTLPTDQGDITSLWYPFVLIGAGNGAYIRAENLTLEVSAHDPAYASRRRAIFIHETGWEERDE